MERLGDVLGRLTRRSTSAATASSPEAELPGAATVPDRREAQACPLCQGHGWGRRQVPLGHPDFGKAFPCTCKLGHMQQQRQADLVRYSGLEHVGRFTFQTFSPAGRGPATQGPATAAELHHLQQALAAAQAYAQGPQRWLVLTGPSGCGKTHLAAAISNSVVERGRPVFFITVPDLLDRFRSSFSPSSDIAYSDLFERVCNTPLLVLDDLGAHSSSPWAQEKLLQLLNHRYNLLLPTVITVGVPATSLEERLRSRLLDPAVSKMVEVAPRQGRARLCIGRSEESLASMTFASFDLDRPGADAQGRASLERALRFCREFAETPKGWLLLAGPTLCGKTHLSAAVFNQQKRVGLPVIYAWVPALMEELRGAFRPGSDVAYDELFEQVKEAPVLLLDDLGSEHSTAWAQEKLHQLLVHRYDIRLPTVVTTQLSYEALEEKLPPALASRLLNPHTVGILPIGVSEYRPPRRSQPPRRRQP